MLDFGLARTLGTDDALASAAEREETSSADERIDVPTGTPGYMAPEQWRRADASYPADVWALGTIVYMMCAGRRPFHAEGLAPLAIAVCGPEPAPALPVGPGVPRALSELVARCLDKDPARRPSADDVVQTLSAMISAGGTAAGREAPVPTLAVLPLTLRGSSEHADLGDALTDELIDQLSRMRGWRVLASAATARFREGWDPKTVADELGVQAIVHGTVQASGDRLRVTARMLDARGGAQSWCERFEGRLADIRTCRTSSAAEIAEALRSELTATFHRGDASSEAVALYLHARQKISRDLVHGPGGALELLEACLHIAPTFKPALAAHATASMRCWFIPTALHERDWETVARRSVARAAEGAAELADTHMARAGLRIVDGDYGGSVASLIQALAIAPTCAAAHGYMAMLEIEAGHAGEGLRRARLALDLDPSTFLPLIDIARYHALHGDWKAYAAVSDELEARVPDQRLGVLVSRLRVAAWRRDHDAIRRGLEAVADRDAMQFELFRLPLLAILGEMSVSDALDAFSHHTGQLIHPRFRSFATQLYAETSFLTGAYEVGERILIAAADDMLVDIEWLDHCPALEPMRQRPMYAATRRKVAERARAVWQAGSPPLESVNPSSGLRLA